MAATTDTSATPAQVFLPPARRRPWRAWEVRRPGFPLGVALRAVSGGVRAIKVSGGAVMAPGQARPAAVTRGAPECPPGVTSSQTLGLGAGLTLS